MLVVLLFQNSENCKQNIYESLWQNQKSGKMILTESELDFAKLPPLAKY